MHILLYCKDYHTYRNKVQILDSYQSLDFVLSLPTQLNCLDNRGFCYKNMNQEFELYYDMYGNLCNTGEYAYIIYVSCTINDGTFKTDITYQINKKLRLYSNEVTSAGESYRIKKVESA